MQRIQRYHDRICEEFLKGNIPLEVFLILDNALDRIKESPLFKINNN